MLSGSRGLVQYILFAVRMPLQHTAYCTQQVLDRCKKSFIVNLATICKRLRDVYHLQFCFLCCFTLLDVKVDNSYSPCFHSVADYLRMKTTRAHTHTLHFEFHSIKYYLYKFILLTFLLLECFLR